MPLRKRFNLTPFFGSGGSLPRDSYTELHRAFMARVKHFYHQKFSLHYDYTGDFDTDKSKDNFGRELKAYIEECTEIINPFNHRTLINFISQGISPNAKTNTLDTLSKFCGCNSFEEFSGNLKPKRKRGIFPIIILIISVLSMLFYLLYREHQKEEIYEVIALANKAQFQAMKSLPEISFGELEKYYTTNGSAYKVITDIIKRSKEKQRTLGLPVDNPSYYTVHRVKIISLGASRALVKSQEHWYVRWFNTTTNRYEKKYDETNEQVYVLNKENGIWKITANDYEGTAEDL